MRNLQRKIPVRAPYLTKPAAITPSSLELKRELVRLYKSWLYTLKYCKAIIQKYPRVAGEFCNFLRNRQIDETTSWDIRSFLIDSAKRKSFQYGTIQITLAALRSFFEFLSLGGIVSATPIRAVRMRRCLRNPPAVVSPETVLRLIASAKRPRDIAAVELLYATGCRAGELVGIRVEDVDFESRTIRVTGKFGKSRYVVFGRHGERALRAYLCGRNSGYVFQSATLQPGRVYKQAGPDTWVGKVSVYTDDKPPVQQRTLLTLGPTSKMSRGEAWRALKQKICGLDTVRPADGPMATNTLRKIVDALACRAGLQKLTPHQFRHAFATHMLNGGADIREIQELLGHACLSTTEVYTHVGRKRLLERFDACHPRGDKYRAAHRVQA